MITCPICQSENEEGFTECILCGAPLPEPEEASSSSLATEAEPDPVSPSSQESATRQNMTPPSALEPKSPHGALTTPPASKQSISRPDILAQLPTTPSGNNSPGSVQQSTLSKRLISMGEQGHLSAGGEFAHTTRSPEQTLPTSKIEQPQEPTLPPSGTLCLIVYFQRRPAYYLPVLYDELLIGRTDPASNAYPDMDVTPYDPELAISRKHCYIYREGDDYYIYPISNSGTQVNQEMIDIGTKKRLNEGDVIILSGRLAIRFARTS